MPRYANLNGDSGVVGYEIGDDWIEVEFERGRYRFYLYTVESASSEHIRKMKELAASGAGLNAYINYNVKTMYASKR